MDTFLGCLGTITSCKKNPKDGQNTRCQTALLATNLTVLFLAACLTLLWIGFWQALDENDRLNILEFAYGASGAWAEWCEIFFGLSVFTFTYLLIFVVIVACLIHFPLMRGKTASLKMHFLYLILNAFILVFCLAFMGAIQSLYAQGWSLVKLKIIYSAPAFHLVLIAILTIVVGLLCQRGVARYFYNSNGIRGVSLTLKIFTGECLKRNNGPHVGIKFLFRCIHANL